MQIIGVICLFVLGCIALELVFDVLDDRARERKRRKEQQR